MINKKKYGAVAFQCFTLEQVKEINKEIKKNITKKENPSKAAQNVSKIGEFCHVPCMSLMEDMEHEKNLLFYLHVLRH